MLFLPINTERLIIRELRLDDASFILDLLNDPSFLKYIGDRGIRNLQDAKAYILDGPVASYFKHKHGLYLVALKKDKRPLGICGLLQRDYLEDPDIGFAFLEKYRKKGYAFESADAIMKYSFETLGVTRIVAITSSENKRSAKLLEKLGMHFQKKITIPGETRETYYFST